ncbi:MAG: hypothetical protein ACREX8_19225, partial [Gammaproteobacteria bacterium]
GLLDEGRPIGLGHDRRSDLIELARDRLGEGEGIGRLGIGLEREALGIAEIGNDGDPARRDLPAMKIEADGLYRSGRRERRLDGPVEVAPTCVAVIPTRVARLSNARRKTRLKASRRSHGLGVGIRPQSSSSGTP